MPDAQRIAELERNIDERHPHPGMATLAEIRRWEECQIAIPNEQLPWLLELAKRGVEAEAKLDTIRSKLESIVCTIEPDAGVVLLSDHGTTHYDPEAKVQVYDHEYFSPLGDALMEVWKLTNTKGTEHGS